MVPKLTNQSDPPSSMELEPLGGDIPTDDPVIEDDGIDPRPLAGYQWGGDVGNAEYGCVVDGYPSDQCMMLLQSGIAVPDVRAEQPFPLGYWVDEDGPSGPPDDDEFIYADSVMTHFYPFILPSFNYGDPISPECLAAIIGVVPTKWQSYAKTAVPLLDAATGGWSWSMFAYLLATVEHESRFGTPREDLSYSASMYEDWDPDHPTRAQQSYEHRLGNLAEGDGYLFRGRGYIQVTGRAAYFNIGKALGYPNIRSIGNEGGSAQVNAFVINPDLLADPKIAALAAAVGLRNDIFTQGGRSLDKFLPNNSASLDQFRRARVFVNGQDDALQIAKRAMRFLDAMRGECF